MTSKIGSICVIVLKDVLFLSGIIAEFVN